MPNPEFAGQSSGSEWDSGYLTNYKPAFPLGNEKDAHLIAKSSGRPVEDFLHPWPIEKTPDYIPEAWEVVDDPKEG